MKFTLLCSVFAAAKAQEATITDQPEMLAQVIDLNNYDKNSADWNNITSNTFESLNDVMYALGIGLKSWTNSAPGEPKNLWFGIMKTLELIQEVKAKNNDMNVTFNTEIQNSVTTITNNTKNVFNDLTKEGKYDLEVIAGLQEQTLSKLEEQQGVLKESVSTSLDSVEVKLDYLIRVAEILQTALGDYAKPVLTFSDFKQQASGSSAVQVPVSGIA